MSSVAANAIGQAMAPAAVCWREDTRGANTKIRKNTVASLTSAAETGNSAKVMASTTTTFSAGEANIVASTDSVLTPGSVEASDDRSHTIRAHGERGTRGPREQSVQVARIAATPRERSQECERGGAEQQRKGHPNAIGVEPVYRRAKYPRGKRHGGIDGVDSAEGERSRRFNLCPGMIALQQGGVAGVHPEEASDGQHKKDSQTAAAPRTGGPTDGLRFRAEAWTDTLAPFARIRTEAANKFAGLYKLPASNGIVEKHYGGGQRHLWHV